MPESRRGVIFVQARIRDPDGEKEERERVLSMGINTKSKCLIALILLGIVDTVIPVPILVVILLYVLFQKPPWFMDLVQEIYDKK